MLYVIDEQTKNNYYNVISERGHEYSSMSWVPVDLRGYPKVARIISRSHTIALVFVDGEIGIMTYGSEISGNELLKFVTSSVNGNKPKFEKTQPSLNQYMQYFNEKSSKVQAHTITKFRFRECDKLGPRLSGIWGSQGRSQAEDTNVLDFLKLVSMKNERKNG